jgi:putative CocE/NonD family hydrolase
MAQNHDGDVPQRTRSLRGYGSLTLTPLAGDIAAERDVEVPLRDGVRLRCNVFRTRDAGPQPVLLHCVPYGKDDTGKRGILWDRWVLQYRMMKQVLGGDIGELTMSEATPWEAIDPNVWCPRGYVVVACDSRGFGRSDVAGQGGAPKASLLSEQEAKDYYDVVEWCAAQPWSNGRVGTIGVSYLAMSQWVVLSWAQPPSLRAACLWEACAEPLAALANHGGAGPSRFSKAWFTTSGRNARGGAKNFAQDFASEFRRLPEERNVFAAAPQLAATAPPIERIDPNRTAMLVVGSWSDQGVHNPGLFEGWRRLRTSPHAFLLTHGRSKWDGFYNWGQPALARFFEHYLLKGSSDPAPLPPVSLEVRVDETTVYTREEMAFPPERMQAVSLQLGREQWNPKGGGRETEGGLEFVARGGSLQFTHVFDQRTELVGTMALEMFVSLHAAAAGGRCGDDAIVAVQLHKLRADKSRVHFPGVMGDIHEGVARGYLRLSHHVSFDPEASTPLRPVYRHDRAQPLQPGEAIPVKVMLNPSATVFEPGEALLIIITGKEPAAIPVMTHPDIAQVNRKDTRVVVHLDARHPLTLILPVVPDDGRKTQTVRYCNPA